MSTKHWLIVAGFLGMIAAQLAGVEHWHEVLTPTFVAGLLGQAVLLITAIFTGKPMPAWDGTNRRKP